MSEALIVSGFPGVGKTNFCKYLNDKRQKHNFGTPCNPTMIMGRSILTVLDSDSSNFTWHYPNGVGEGQPKERNPEFPDNYIKHIKDNMENADIILVSSHAVVRNALIAAGMEFWLVFPGKDTKSEYLKRYEDRGSDNAFVKLLDENWDQWIGECLDFCCAKEVHPVVLGSGQYLTDWLKGFPSESLSDAAKRVAEVKNLSASEIHNQFFPINISRKSLTFGDGAEYKIEDVDGMHKYVELKCKELGIETPVEVTKHISEMCWLYSQVFEFPDKPFEHHILKIMREGRGKQSKFATSPSDFRVLYSTLEELGVSTDDINKHIHPAVGSIEVFGFGNLREDRCEVKCGDSAGIMEHVINLCFDKGIGDPEKVKVARQWLHSEQFDMTGIPSQKTELMSKIISEEWDKMDASLIHEVPNLNLSRPCIIPDANGKKRVVMVGRASMKSTSLPFVEWTNTEELAKACNEKDDEIEAFKRIMMMHESILEAAVQIYGTDGRLYLGECKFREDPNRNIGYEQKKDDDNKCHLTITTDPKPEAVCLTERRSIYVYGTTRLAAEAAGAPVIPAPWHAREQAFKTQFMNAIEKQCGPERSMSPEEAHENWMKEYEKMGWVFGEEYSKENKTHPDMVPYNELGQLEKDKDEVFIATCEIARKFIYDKSPEYSVAGVDWAEGEGPNKVVEDDTV